MDHTPQPNWGIKLSKYFIIPQRYILGLMGFFAIINAYTMRSCLSLTITRMVKERNYTGSNDSNKSGVCPKEEATEHFAHTGEFDWDQTMQGYILGSFYVGYVITHIPGGLLAERYGGKWVLSLGILITSLCTLITPPLILWFGGVGLICLRVVTGAGQGTTFPALGALLANWAPAKERAILGTLVLGGGQMGTLIGGTISGIMLDDFDWPWVFYLFGFFGVIWFIFFSLLCFNGPNAHPFIKPKEKEYLFAAIGNIEIGGDLPPTPWRAIMTSAPMLALICAQIGHDWGFYAMSSDLPKYMNDVMQFPIEKNGIYSSLPFFSMWVVSILSAFLTDSLVSNNMINVTNIRKINTAFAAIGPAIFMVGASYAGCRRFIVVLCFIISLGLMGPYYSGMKLGPLDMSPHYAATLMAVSNGIGAIAGCVSPPVIGMMTPNTNIEEWRWVFWLTFLIMLVTAIIYCIWASGEVQPWDKGKV